MALVEICDICPKHILAGQSSIMLNNPLQPVEQRFVISICDECQEALGASKPELVKQAICTALNNERIRRLIADVPNGGGDES